jgi:Fur family peroxide stress response transcriptional regulator
MSSEKYAHFKELCQGGGVKVTHQRFVIYKRLVDCQEHPTADRLYEMVAPEVPGLSRDTVYRTLHLLAEKGLALKLVMPGGAARFDGDLSLHHHFLCESCGRVFDLPWPEFDALPWPESALKLGRPRRAQTLILGLGPCCQGGQG